MLHTMVQYIGAGSQQLWHPTGGMFARRVPGTLPFY